MRSNQNPSVSTNRSVGTKLRVPMSGMPMSGMPMSGMPMEWLDAGSWRLPSGKALAEFALQAGFLAPLLFRVERFGASRTKVAAGPDAEVRRGHAAKILAKGGSQ